MRYKDYQRLTPEGKEFYHFHRAEQQRHLTLPEYMWFIVILVVNAIFHPDSIFWVTAPLMVGYLFLGYFIGLTIKYYLASKKIKSMMKGGQR